MTLFSKYLERISWAMKENWRNPDLSIWILFYKMCNIHVMGIMDLFIFFSSYTKSLTSNIPIPCDEFTDNQSWLNGSVHLCVWVWTWLFDIALLHGEPQLCGIHHTTTRIHFSQPWLMFQGQGTSDAPFYVIQHNNTC